jgi:broad specificity phosphatase PhoE
LRRLLLVRHAPTRATRATAFPLDEPLDDAGRLAAAALAAALPRRCEVLSSPAVRCRETAEAAGLTPDLDDALIECDFGRWAGMHLADVDDEGARSWILDPDAAPHGGETLRAFAGRVGRWLDAQSAREGVAAAITHGGVVRAAVVHALRAPLPAFWQVDAAPLSVTELHAHDGRWTVARLNDVVGA